jgi:hypothetical protein
VVRAAEDNRLKDDGMKVSLTVSLLLSLCLAAPAVARGPNPHEAEFQAFRKELIAASKANDKAKLADLIAFPVEYWSIEKDHKVEEGTIASREEFLKRYDTLFTEWMRQHLIKAKSESLENGRYLMSWADGGSEFTFVMEFVEPAGWRVRAYGIGAE